MFEIKGLTMNTDNLTLRRRAEEFLDGHPEAVNKIPAGDLHKLIEDLHVHQIELEMQNEELRRTQLELEKARDKYSDLYDFAPVGYFTISDKGFILEANLNGARLFNIERRNLIDEKFNRLIPPHHQDKFYHHCNAVFKSKTKQTCDLELVRKDGTRFYARMESLAIQEKAGNSRQIRTTVTDISDRVQTRELLHQSEEKYRLLFNEMISGYALHEIIFDSNGKPVDSLILEVNKTIEWHTGIKRDQIIGKTVREVLPGTEQEWFEKFAEVVITGNPIQFENYHQQLDKHLMVSAFRLQEGQIAATFTDITDRRRFQKELQKAHDELERRVEARTADLALTNEQLQQEIEERKQAEKALSESELRYRTLFEVSTDAIFLETLEGHILHCNTTACKMFGYTKEELTGLAVADLVPEDVAKTLPDIIKKQISTGAIFIETINKRKGGHVFPVEVRTQLITLGEEQLIFAHVHDITDRKQAESELRRLSSRLLNAQEDERRRIAFELHDELGQDLTVLKLHIDSIKRKLHQDQSALHKAFEEVLLEITQTIEKVRRISRDLSPSVLVDLGLNAALRGMLKTFAKHSNIEISTDIQDTKNLFSSEQQIAVYRIFQEIITNISKHAHASKVSIVGKKKSSKVIFRVKDNGIGFDIEEINARHAPEKGLGLAAMAERAKMLDGHFEISSQVNSGTIVAFEVPIDSSPNKGVM
jgi:PAS domain S-box-containing protein